MKDLSIDSYVPSFFGLISWRDIAEILVPAIFCLCSRPYSKRSSSQRGTPLKKQSPGICFSLCRGMASQLKHNIFRHIALFVLFSGCCVSRSLCPRDSIENITALSITNSPNQFVVIAKFLRIVYSVRSSCSGSDMICSQS